MVQNPSSDAILTHQCAVLNAFYTPPHDSVIDSYWTSVVRQSVQSSVFRSQMIT